MLAPNPEPLHFRASWRKVQVQITGRGGWPGDRLLHDAAQSAGSTTQSKEALGDLAFKIPDRKHLRPSMNLCAGVESGAAADSEHCETKESLKFTAVAYHKSGVFLMQD